MTAILVYRLAKIMFASHRGVYMKNHEMEAILDFTYNAMSKIISGHTNMSGIPENPMVDTKIMNLLIFHLKLCKYNR